MPLLLPPCALDLRDARLYSDNSKLPEVNTMRRVYIRLEADDIDRLLRRARRNRRHPADEAAIIVRRALRQRPADKRAPAERKEPVDAK